MPFRYSHRRFMPIAGLLGAIWLGTVIPAQAAQDEEKDDSASSDEDAPGQAESETPEAATESENPEAATESETPEAATESAPTQPAAEPAPLNAAEVALEAQRVHSEYCGSLQGTDRGLAGESFAVIGPIWSRVSGAYRELGEIYLLYWSGLLSECLGRGDDAVSDLEAFLADEKSRPLVSMVADAEWRLRRKARANSSPGISKRRGPRPLAFQLRARGAARSQGGFAAFLPSIGFGVAASAGAVIALSGWSEAGDEIPQQGEDEVGMPRMILDESIRAATERMNAAQVVGTVSIGLAVSSAVSLLIASVSQAQRRSKAATKAADVRSYLHVAPGPDGVLLGVTTQW